MVAQMLRRVHDCPISGAKFRWQKLLPQPRVLFSTTLRMVVNSDHPLRCATRPCSSEGLLFDRILPLIYLEPTTSRASRLIVIHEPKTPPDPGHCPRRAVPAHLSAGARLENFRLA